MTPITTTAELQAFCDKIKGQPFVAVDTEFMRETTYWPKLCLIQAASPNAEAVIDPLADGIDLEPFLAVLRDPAIEKVFHAARQDVEIFNNLNAMPTPLFDTQAAAALCGLGAGLSYQKLVQAVTGVELAKGETRSDWLRRPLSAAQLAYAADDVRHLHALHRDLQARLAGNGRAAWLEEDSARQLANAASDDGERWPHLAIRSAQFLDAEGQRRLLRLLRWRDAHARSSDRPRSWILDNELAVALARQKLDSRLRFDALLDGHPKSPRSLRTPLWEALITPLIDEAKAPLARGDDRDKKQLRALQDAVAMIAGELQLPEGLLASRKVLEALQDGSGWTGQLAGWRRALLEPRLAPLL